MQNNICSMTEKELLALLEFFFARKKHRFGCSLIKTIIKEIFGQLAQFKEQNHSLKLMPDCDSLIYLKQQAGDYLYRENDQPK